MVIISKLKDQTKDRLETCAYKWEAYQLVVHFEQFKFQQIKRGGNRVAHLLTKEGFLRRHAIGGGEAFGGYEFGGEGGDEILLNCQMSGGVEICCISD